MAPPPPPPLPELPFDIITNILTRLPPKPLLRFKSVSKPWYSTITNPDFIKSHLSLTTTENILLRGSFLHSLNHSNPSPKPTPLPYPYKTTTGGVEILGTCNGLVLLSISGDNGDIFCIWNPSTQEYKTLPATPIEFLGNAFCSRSVLYGIGYDHTIDDYKVVRIVNYYGDEDEIDSEVKVYRLGSNSWRMVQGVPYHILYKRVWGILVNGGLHWAATRLPESDVSKVIGRFDIVDEVFREVPQPSYENDDFHMNVEVLGGCLCVLCNYDSDVCDIWVMKIYGEQESWSKLLSIKRGSVFGRFDYLKPLCYTKDGGILMEKNGNKNKIVLYNPKLKKVKTIHTSVDATDWCESDTYVESLVSLKSGTYVGKEYAHVKRKENKKKAGKKRASVTEEKKPEVRRELPKMQEAAPVISLKNPHSRHPELKWAQREDKLYITIMLSDAKDARVNLEPEGTFTFSATAGGENHLYEMELHLFNNVNVEESKINIGPRSIFCVVVKAEEGWWTKLLRGNDKTPHFVKVDWDKWADEDDEGPEVDTSGMDFSDMGGMEDDDYESDDD